MRVTSVVVFHTTSATRSRSPAGTLIGAPAELRVVLSVHVWPYFSTVVATRQPPTGLSATGPYIPKPIRRPGTWLAGRTRRSLNPAVTYIRTVIGVPGR